MDIKCYLAMTAAEFAAAAVMPGHMAWMACHFSSYGTGLSNLPRKLPEGSMVIVNDRTPPNGHDPDLITQQLLQLAQEQSIACFLLDFQRSDMEENLRLAQQLTRDLPYPVGVTELYAKALDCAVFLSAPAPHCALETHLAPWAGREIWLEAAIETEQVTVTERGSKFVHLPDTDLTEPVFLEDTLHCRYRIDLMEDRVVFTLRRGRQEAAALLAQAQKLGVNQAVGLYQQLGKEYSNEPTEL